MGCKLWFEIIRIFVGYKISSILIHPHDPREENKTFVYSKSFIEKKWSKKSEFLGGVLRELIMVHDSIMAPKLKCS